MKMKMTMRKLFLIFTIIVAVSIGSFAVLWSSNPAREKETTLASQGIRLVGSAIVVDGSTETVKVKLGDMLIGNDDRLFRINELRKSHTGTMYVVVSWKSITKYSTYDEFIAEPYLSYATYELESFVNNRNIITADELREFYKKYSTDIALSLNKVESDKNAAMSQTIERNEAEAATATASIRLPRAPASAPSQAVEAAPVPAAPPQMEMPVAPPEIAPKVIEYRRTDDQTVQAYPTEQVIKPEEDIQQDTGRQIPIIEDDTSIE